MEIICDHSLCTACGACHDICPKSAITIKHDSEGFLFPVVDQSLCIDCKLCQKVCSVMNPERIKHNKLCDIDVHEGWSLNDTIRSKSSSGAIFGQLAYDLLSTGKWKVVGAAFDGRYAFHKLISSAAELGELQNTKYIQSNPSLIYREILAELKNGINILFSGTPCQVAGCYSYLDKKKYSGELLTMEVVCHGVPSHLILDKSIEFNKAKSVTTFRNKNDGWGYNSQQMTYVKEDGSLITKSRDTDLFYRFFFGKKKLRKSCYQCPFAKLPRTADITIGDSWGTTNSSEEERRKGLSLVISNNSHASEILNKSKNIHLREIGWFTEIEINRNLYTPFPPISFIAERNDVNYIQNQLTRLDVNDFLNTTQLGFIENKEKLNLLKKALRKVNNKIYFKLVGNGNLSTMSSLRMRLIYVSMKLRNYTADLPSQHFLSLKFLKLTKEVYKAKHS